MSISNHDRIKAYSQLEIHLKQGFGKYSRISRLISDILGKVYSDVLCSGVPIHFLQLLVWGIALIPVFRIIIFSKFDAHTSPLFSHLDDVITYFTSLFLYQHSCGKLPSVFDNVLKLLADSFCV